MKAVRYHEKGAPEVMRVEEVETPRPDADEALVRVEAAAVHYGDVLSRSGAYYPVQRPLPTIPGWEVLGVVEAVGDGVDEALIGTRVMGSVTSGAYAEYAVGPISGLKPAPEDLDPHVAMAGVQLGVTATLILTTTGRLAPGESVWVPAAGGALGSLAIQLAKLHGAGRVYAGASSEAKRALALEAGADEVFDYTQAGWSEQVIAANGGAGVDLALETVGGDVFYETLEVVRAGGRIVNYGNASDTDSPVNPRALLRRNLTLSGYMDGFHTEAADRARDEVIGLLREGRLRPRVGGVHAMSEAPAAHRAVQERTAAGKLIIVPAG